MDLVQQTILLFVLLLVVLWLLPLLLHPWQVQRRQQVLVLLRALTT